MDLHQKKMPIRTTVNIKYLPITTQPPNAGIESFNADNLKNVETKEKTVLPAPEDIQVEKTIQGILQGVESFDSDTLKEVKTREPASPAAMIQVRYSAMWPPQQP